MYILKLDGMEIEVSEEVYKEFYRYQRKERYFSEDLKSGRIYKDRVSGKEVYLSPREVSLEGILEQGGAFGRTMQTWKNRWSRLFLEKISGERWKPWQTKNFS